MESLGGALGSRLAFLACKPSADRRRDVMPTLGPFVSKFFADHCRVVKPTPVVSKLFVDHRRVVMPTPVAPRLPRVFFPSSVAAAAVLFSLFAVAADVFAIGDLATVPHCPPRVFFPSYSAGFLAIIVTAAGASKPFGVKGLGRGGDPSPTEKDEETYADVLPPIPKSGRSIHPFLAWIKNTKLGWPLFAAPLLSAYFAYKGDGQVPLMIGAFIKLSISGVQYEQKEVKIFSWVGNAVLVSMGLILFLNACGMVTLTPAGKQLITGITDLLIRSFDVISLRDILPKS